MKTLAIFAAFALTATSLFASADLVATLSSFDNGTVIRAGSNTTVFFSVRNNGPDTAPSSTIAISSPVPTTCNCTLGDIPSGQSRSGSISFIAPPGNGTIVITVTASSNAFDPSPDDNVASVSLTVSTDPDVTLRFSVPLTQDRGLPFSVPLFLGNNSNTTAHDLEVTLAFTTAVVVQSLPSGCTSIGSGRILCRLDALPPTTQPGAAAFTLLLVAPTSSYSFPSVTFTGIVTEREHDFDPISNTYTQEMALYRTFYVTNTRNDGSGSLRQAILDANSQTGGPTGPRAIGFQIEEGSATPWKTILITSPLPAINAGIRVDGAIQTGFFGDKNPDGPEIEIRAAGNVDGDGLVVANCASEIANLAINGFRGNGLGVIDSPNCPAFSPSNLHHLFVGTDPTGSEARPNGQRGIATSYLNGTDINSVRGTTNIHDCVLSGNGRSGLFAFSGRVDVWGNRIGVKAHTDEPLPNGASGIFIGPGGYGSKIGPDVFTSLLAPNVIAFNHDMGIAIDPTVGDVSVRGNRIWSNGTLGIDIGLDGPTLSTSSRFEGSVGVPLLTLAHYDPVSKKTVVEGDAGGTLPGGISSFLVDLYANDFTDPSGFGEGQRPIGIARATNFTSATHFRLEVDGDLTGRFITGTTTRVYYVGFAKPEGIDQLYLSQTSEFGRALEVR